MDSAKVISRLIDLRQRNGYTQQMIADKLNICVSSVKNWESGNCLPGTENIYALADLYHVTTDYILGRDTDNMICVPNASKKEVQRLTRMIQAYMDYRQDPE